MSKIRKTPVGLNCLIVLSEEFITVVDDNVCTAPIKVDKDILESAQSSKNFIDADSEDGNEMNNAAPVPLSSKMRNVIKLSSCEPFSAAAGGYNFAFIVTRITFTCSEMDITLSKRSKVITLNQLTVALQFESPELCVSRKSSDDEYTRQSQIRRSDDEILLPDHTQQVVKDPSKPMLLLFRGVSQQMVLEA
ncbi:hypothetical protein TNCV_1446261 [Trichonephila clavipes]|nr:hypothetical protein TNCV_1446261 [Trichonephila clavipes]